MTEATAQPTSAAEWRRPREEGYTVTLPSGKVARLRPVALDVLVASGKIPDVLTAMAARMMWQIEDEEEEKEEDQSFERAVQNIEFTNLITRSAMIEPCICDEGCEDCEECILIEDVDFDDRIAIQKLSLLPAEAMRKFRDKQIADVADVSDGEGDQPETE